MKYDPTCRCLFRTKGTCRITNQICTHPEVTLGEERECPTYQEQAVDWFKSIVLGVTGEEEADFLKKIMDWDRLLEWVEDSYYISFGEPAKLLEFLPQIIEKMRLQEFENDFDLVEIERARRVKVFSAKEDENVEE
jgi:hypothetical protein